MKTPVQAIFRASRFLLFAVAFFGWAYCPAATIKGQLLDEDKEPMIGARVLIKNATYYGVVGLDGTYVISNVPVGSHTLVASYMGYAPQEKTVTIQSEKETLRLDFRLEAASEMLSEFVVQGKAEAGSDLEARRNEKNAPHVMNIVSAKTIEISPDITVANVIQRVSGVSLVRNSSGDPQYAIVRGMDKRYNYTLVNGVKIPSPDNQNRYIPLDIFPAQLLERLEVSKSLTPSMEGDAIGGAVNMVMKNAPDRLSIKGDLQMGYNQVFLQRSFLQFDRSAVKYETPMDKYGPTYQAQVSDFTTKNLDVKSVTPLPDLLGSLSIGNRFFGNKLGVLLAGSFQNSYRGTNSIWFKTSTDYFGSNQPSLDELQERTYSTQQTRYALHARLDYVINKNHRLNLYAGNYRLINNQTRDVMTSQLDARFYSAENGNAILTFTTRTRVTDQNIATGTLRGDHRLNSAWQINWSAVYAKATSDQPDNAQFERNSGLHNFKQDPETIERHMPRRWDSNTDQDYTGYLNVLFTPAFLGPQNELSAGGMYRKKQRSNFYNKYTFDPEPATQTRGVDWNTFSDVKLTLLNPLGSTYDEQNYDSHENLLDYYLQGKFLVLGHTQILGGVRVESTDQGYALRYSKPNQAPTLSQKYTDVLPSVSVKYRASDHMNVRASYYKAISRPGYFEIVPYYSDSQEGYPEVGNPTLKRIKAHNYDLRWEYFPNAVDQILVGVFYKKIIDPIEYANVPYGDLNQIVTQPGNYGTAYNWGIEADYTKYFNKFGIRANYTFTNSRITTTKTIRTRENPNDPSSQTIILYAQQTRPLQGQAKHIGNLSLLYKDQKRGTNLQLAFVYTGERIESVSPFLDNDTWQKPILQMDFSGEQRLNKHLEVFVKAQNLLNSPYEVVIKKPHLLPEKEYKLQESSSTTLIRKDQYYQSYRIGIRYTL